MTSMNRNLDWAARALKPEHVNIKPKKLGMQLGDDTPTYWYDDNPFLTHVLTALGATFPSGEQFMIDTVRLFRKDIKDIKRLDKECGGFIGQEAHHSKEHEVVNDFMESRGLPVEDLTAFIDWWIPIFQGLPEKDQLAITGAAEHFTALFGDLVLSNEDIVAKVHPTVQPIWIWHAIEEVEHKAVTYDLFEAIDGDYIRRLYGYVIALALIGGFTAYGTALFTWKDRRNFSLKKTFSGLNTLFGIGKNKGYLIKAIPAAFDYIKRDYHPWYHDNSDLIVTWRARLNELTQ